MDLELEAMVEPLFVSLALNSAPPVTDKLPARSVAVSIVQTSSLKPQQTIIVLGCGPTRILTQAAAKACGARKVTGVDVVQSRLGLARSFGANNTSLLARTAAD